MNYTLILNSNNRVDKANTNANDSEYLFDWSVLPEGKYKISYSLSKFEPIAPPLTLVSRTFLTNDSFTVPNNVNKIELFMIGGGGGGGSDTGSGGAAGQYILNTNLAVNSAQVYNITIGNGGVGVSGNNNGTNGGSSSFGVIFCIGGQGGTTARLGENSGPYSNTSGGSAVNGFSSFNPSVPAVNCFRGGFGSPSSTNFGGCGAGCNGNATNATENGGGISGIGVLYKNIPYGGGGFGGTWRDTFTYGDYNAWGGGVGGVGFQNLKRDAITYGSGGGGNGNGGTAGGNGKSGICIITYLT